MKRSFTIIEVSLIVALIAILTAIAIPNIENFMMRSRDTRRLADMELLGEAFEAFYADKGRYPDHANDGIGGGVGNGECIGDFDFFNSVAKPDDDQCNGAGVIEKVLRPYLQGNMLSDPLYHLFASNNPNYYYAYDSWHGVSWCDSVAANNTQAPVFGFRRAETQEVRQMCLDRKAACSGPELELDQADYNVALIAP
jgi:type II secretory pathway pseudopilin PulG